MGNSSKKDSPQQAKPRRPKIPANQQVNQPENKPVTLQETKKLRAFSDAVGDFIRYWGFRRIHGQIWTQVFLSKESLSGTELTERLGVSKALISPALTELETHGLIVMTQFDKKTKRYTAAPDVVSVIKKIIQEREVKMIKNARTHFDSLHKIHQKNSPDASVLNSERLDEVGQMISLAQFALGFLLGQSDELALEHWSETAEKNLTNQ